MRLFMLMLAFVVILATDRRLNNAEILERSTASLSLIAALHEANVTLPSWQPGSLPSQVELFWSLWNT